MYHGGWKARIAFWRPPPDLLLEDPVASGPPPAWAPRRGRRRPDIDSVLVRAAFVRIWARSRTVPKGISGGVVTSQHRGVPMEDARAGGGRWDWVVVLSPWACSASSRRRWGAQQPQPATQPSIAGPPRPAVRCFTPPIFRWLLFYEKSRGKSGGREIARRGGETRDRARENRPALAPHSPRRPLPPSEEELSGLEEAEDEWWAGAGPGGGGRGGGCVPVL